MAAQTNIDAPISISFKQFVDYAFAHWLESIKTGMPCKTLALLGPPGIGKSSTAYALAKRMTDYVRQNPQVIFKGKQPSKDEIEAVCRLLDFSSMLPEDLNGLPFREGQYTRYCPQEWTSELCGEHAFGVVVQDDLPAAAPAMHTAGRQMALERRIHEHRFGPGILIIVTGNRREDKSAASTLPAHFRNSVTLLGIEPDVDEWKKWYGKQEHHSPMVSAYLTWQPQHLSSLPKDDDKMGAFATPRQWASLGRQFDAAKQAGSDVLLAVASGLVGKGKATTFLGFVEVYAELPDPGKVLDNPKGALPNPGDALATPDKQIAMTMALGDIAARRFKGCKASERVKIAEKLMRALAHVCDGIGEYTATGVQAFLDSGGNLTAIAKVARDKRNDPGLGPMLDHIKEALLGGS
jgi:ABC-type dipeptide/oligopeptide/nickel transport system ATPase component